MALYISRKLKHYQWLCNVVAPDYLRLKSTITVPRGDAVWGEIIYLASIHGVLPCLFERLKTNQLLEYLPADVSEALEGFYELNNLSNTALRDQVLATTRILNSGGIEPVWLKGASILLTPCWESSSRTMLDLDLWIPKENDQLRAIEILTKDGYFMQPESVGADYGPSQHYAPIIKSGQPARLEIHRHVVSPFCSSLLPDKTALEGVICRREGELSYGILSSDDQIMQSYLQCTEQGSDSFNPRNTVRLMKMVDFLERFSSEDLIDKWFSHNVLLNKEPWALKARQFNSHLSSYFSVRKQGSIDESYLRNIALALNFPKLEIICHIIKHGTYLLFNGGLGPVNAWPGKLYRQLLTLRG